MPRKNKIIFRTGTGAPSAADFATGEPGFDSVAGTLYIKNAAGSMAQIAGGSDAITPASIGAAAADDARLSDTRTPTDGSVTDAKITSGGLSTSVLNWAAIQPWAANTSYAKGDLVSNAGIAYRRSAAGMSGATFNSANWQQITPSSFVASQISNGTLDQARLDFVPLHPFLLMGG